VRQLDVDDILQEAYVAAFKALTAQNHDPDVASDPRVGRLDVAAAPPESDVST